MVKNVFKIRIKVKLFYRENNFYNHKLGTLFCDSLIRHRFNYAHKHRVYFINLAKLETTLK